ncbi:hypothetical protein H109_06028 [Trichophyton interdigitale MR816]|uniref:Uncharacterized protein n=1 Tax=Trichophyton interdigitale (strain MR816) TaxID=1215338 RepID=A0A059J2J3_TRIIM|nr:hypothetical protein H109_06028 [Trichophyton interdigitale MR816]
MAQPKDFKEPSRSVAALESPLRSPLRSMSESRDDPFGLILFARPVAVRGIQSTDFDFDNREEFAALYGDGDEDEEDKIKDGSLHGAPAYVVLKPLPNIIMRCPHLLGGELDNPRFMSHARSVF